MLALTNLQQTEISSVKRIDLEKFVGYPFWLEVNTLNHPRPLFWHSLDEEGLTTKSAFLEATGFSLDILVPEEELARLPSEIREITNLIPAKSCQILQAILISSASTELALSNPILFMLLVLSAEKNNLSEEGFKKLVIEKRTEILNYLGLPAKPSIVKILARTDLSFDYSTDLEVIHQVLSDPQFLSLIPHIKQPCIQHFHFIKRYRARLTTNLLNLITPDTSKKEANHLLVITHDCWRMGMQLNQLNAASSLAELDVLHDRLVTRYNLLNAEQQEVFYLRQYGAFPKPPLPGNEVICPLTCWADLILEGRKMKHCVSSYHHRISEGQIFIYQVHASVRLTLALNSRENGWVLGEIRGVANSNPRKEDLELIHEWYFDVTNQKKPKSRLRAWLNR